MRRKCIDCRHGQGSIYRLQLYRVLRVRTQSRWRRSDSLCYFEHSLAERRILLHTATGPDYSRGSVFALDSQKTPTNDGTRAHLLLIYEDARLEACMTPNWTAVSSKTIAETTCVGLRIVGNFR